MRDSIGTDNLRRLIGAQVTFNETHADFVLNNSSTGFWRDPQTVAGANLGYQVAVGNVDGITSNAITIVHELTHIYNNLLGWGGSTIADHGIDEDGLKTDAEVYEKCFR